jgi:hypothetical protein
MHRVVALVDFDGVVLRNPQATRYIHKKVVTYVSKKASVPMNLAHELNNEIYNTYGHTYLGLKAHGLSKSLEEFNDFVYGAPEEYEHLKIPEGEWGVFYKKLKEAGIKVKLFSNADNRWLNTFIPYDEDLYSFQDYKDSFHDLELLKPKRDIYDFVHYHLPKCKYVLLDDKICNFSVRLADPRWHHIWINPNHPHKCQLTSNQIIAPGLLEAADAILDLVK